MATTFNIVEARDAKSFVITGTTEALSLTLTVENNFGDTFTPVTISGDNLTLFKTTGLTISATDVGASNGYFKDGVYTLTLNDGVTPVTITEGFAALVTKDVMEEVLSYRVYFPESGKKIVQEKTMLLFALDCAAAVGDSDSFQTFIEILQRLK